MDKAWILDGLVYLFALVPSLTVHEWAHAYAASRLGDDTAERLGRLTLNPLPHIDPIGTIMLPLMRVPFGWARPVPVNPARFTRNISMGAGMAITAVAGPLSNAVLALFCTVAFALMLRFGVYHEAIARLLLLGLRVNIALALFNMLPIPPLDGSRIAEHLVPYRYRPAWNSYAQYGPLLLLAVIVMPSFTHINVLAWPFAKINTWAMYLIYAIRGA
jgi:Zn-dependent protease